MIPGCIYPEKKLPKMNVQMAAPRRFTFFNYYDGEFLDFLPFFLLLLSGGRGKRTSGTSVFF